MALSNLKAWAPDETAAAACGAAFEGRSRKAPGLFRDLMVKNPDCSREILSYYSTTYMSRNL